MAEVEVPVPSMEDAAAAPKEREPLPEYDDSKLIRVKGKVKAPVRPDDTERNIQLEKLAAEVKKHSDRIAEIKAIREARRSRGVNPEAAEHKKRKEGLTAEWNAVLKQKMHIREEFQRANTEREVLRNELRETRNRLPRGTRLETLEADIQQLEYKMEHESLTGPEEKKVHKQVQDLTSARPLARQVTTLEEKLKIADAARASAKARLDQCDAVLESIKEREKVELDALNEIYRQREEANVDMPALELEKQESWEIIQVVRAKINEVRDDFNAKWKEWSELNKHYSAWKRHESYRQYQERQAAREAREAERNGDGPSSAATAAAATTLSEPYESEIFTIDQMLQYLRKFVAEEEVSVAKAEEKKVEVPQGLKPFKRKDEDLSFFAAVPKKAKPGKAQQQPKQEKTTEVKKVKLNHTLEVLKMFMGLGIDVPQSTAEVPSTIEKAEAKKQDFLEMRKKAKEEPAGPSRAPETQVLSANGDYNGHAAEEPEAEPEAEEAAPEEPPPEPAREEPVVTLEEEEEAEQEVEEKPEDRVVEKVVVEDEEEPEAEAAAAVKEEEEEEEPAAAPAVVEAAEEEPVAVAAAPQKQLAGPATGVAVSLEADEAKHAIHLRLICV